VSKGLSDLPGRPANGHGGERTTRGPTPGPSGHTGLRPGEKLHERLFYETEVVEDTNVDKILRVVEVVPPIDVPVRARRLLELAPGDRDDELRTALFDLVCNRQVGDSSAKGDGPTDGVGIPTLAAAGSGGALSPATIATALPETAEAPAAPIA
jgi:hypothetical protein